MKKLSEEFRKQFTCLRENTEKHCLGEKTDFTVLIEKEVNRTEKRYCTAKPYSFLVIDATVASDNPSGFRKNLLKRI